MEKLNVAIADDNERMLRLLGAIIESDEELNVVGTAKDGEEAYNVIKTKEPDVVLPVSYTHLTLPTICSV